jgi:hypothetical protein
LYKGGRFLEGFQSKLLLNLILQALGWPLLAGGRCSEVAVNTVLTVHTKQFMQFLKIQLIFALSILHAPFFRSN